MTFIKNIMPPKQWAWLLLSGLYILSACAHGQNGQTGQTGITETPSKLLMNQQSGQWKTYLFLKDALPQNKKIIDYDTLMEIHHTIHRSEGPIPHLDDILAQLISKTNPDPRVDNMILIIAAASIGNSPYPIENTGRLFENILNQHNRLNSWVLAYLGDAIGKYPVDLPEGDHLADVLEEEAAYFTARNPALEEFFGYHFLPPPKKDFIRDYLSTISDLRIRVFERNCYYMLIGNGLTEDQVETALRQVQDQNMAGTGAEAGRPLKYLVSHWNLFFSDTKPVQDPKPEGL